MAMLSQGTQVYALAPSAANPAVLEVIEVECATAFSPGGNPADQVEVTCLSDTVRKYLRGLRTPGQASLTINADPRNASHVRLHQLSEDDSIESVSWVVGWSDGKDIPPTLNQAGTDFELPKTRTWFLCEGYISDFPFDFAANAAVTSAVTIQRTGGSAWIRKTTSA